ncbi:MAG: hypothetical protein SCK28_02790 [Bacillota bacterium]|nr:hypothetical protein [Bacillota bacterium]
MQVNSVKASCNYCSNEIIIIGDKNKPEALVKEYKVNGGKCPKCGSQAIFMKASASEVK